jgi:hypothetical protein
MNNSLRTGTVAVVACDAGGSEILASYILQQGMDAIFVLAGPAVKIFHQRLGNIKIVTLPEALKNCQWVLTSTGWQSDFEWQAIVEGRAANRTVVTFLDHWVNYSERFIRNGVACYPDEIWVGDIYALELARREFPTQCLFKVENPYFQLFVKEVKALEEPMNYLKKNDVLFVCENVDRDGFHQNDAIRYFMENLDCIHHELGRILVRPHPSENVEKYSWVIEEYQGRVELSKGLSLAEEVAVSGVVVGCSSMAMALAAMAGRRVISCIPDYRFPFTLPFKSIEHLSELVHNFTAGKVSYEGR